MSKRIIKDIVIYNKSSEINLAGHGSLIPLEGNEAANNAITLTLKNNEEGECFQCQGKKYDRTDFTISYADLKRVAFVPKKIDESISTDLPKEARRTVTTSNFAVSFGSNLDYLSAPLSSWFRQDGLAIYLGAMVKAHASTASAIILYVCCHIMVHIAL